MGPFCAASRLNVLEAQMGHSDHRKGKTGSQLSRSERQFWPCLPVAAAKLMRHDMLTPFVLAALQKTSVSTLVFLTSR